MVIDWYTVIFQVINFLILVFLLRRFLYGPIINMMAEREAKIIQREEAATDKAAQAENKAHEYEQQLIALQDRDEELLKKAQMAAEEERQILKKKINLEAEKIREEWKDEIYREQKSFTDELRSRIGQQACQIARHCLKDLADSNLEELIFNIFLKKIKGLPEQEYNSLQKAFSDQPPIVLMSSFDLSEKRQQELTLFLDEYFKQRVQLVHRMNENLICGMELDVNGYRVAWNIATYVDGVEKEILNHIHPAQKEAEENEEAK